MSYNEEKKSSSRNLICTLSFNNMKKSIKDYGIYFLTLVLGVAIFYMFNSLDSQEAMLKISESTRSLVKMMISMLGMVSVFVSVILGLLIVYANNFLINRRKKEFGIYMLLGMGKRQISTIILLETILIGIISLFVGIVIGVFGSQFMSILVAKMFEADMSDFQFIFSKDACIKTCIYFAVMYLAVMVFNTATVSRYKLINLLHAAKKNETIKIKNPVLSVLIFIISASILGYAYWTVTGNYTSLTSAQKLLPPILMGIVGTVGVFWSISGFILNAIQSIKGIYLNGTNMFVLRQLNNKINTTVISMSVICLMLFMTISILSASLALRNTMQREDSKKTVVDTLVDCGLDMNELKDVTEISIYTNPELTWEVFFGEKIESIRSVYPNLQYSTAEEIIKISDYNKIASLYGIEQYELNDDEFIMICDFRSMEEARDEALAEGRILDIAGKQYKSKYNECMEGFVVMSTSHVNTGIILVPDNCPLTDDMKEMTFMAANFNSNSEEDYTRIHNIFAENNSNLMQNLDAKGLELNGLTKTTIMEASVGLVTIITFIAIYLGIVFLIASSAILAIQQLTESSDNRQRYTILRKIGCDEKMINGSLFTQIGIFFGMPLVLAIIHSIFGIQFAIKTMSGIASEEDLLPSVIATVLAIGAIYGSYFLATYSGSKNIIKEDN